ncbi:YaaC family protein [Actinoplanes sp. HUAS TT8]|uniref:YaaC family protein n=1 Tax=Actinoplanes sp. HUAS TT8 TaxID=3447453 RepID=UPI003F51EADB
MTSRLGVDEIWSLLRVTRADPPAGIRGARRKTYTAALEQAQQMFTAAASVGVATRPLLLFYGLSQGGRAIAAAAKHVHNDEYRLIGHGIKANTGTLVGPICDVTVYCDRTSAGSFNRLSRILSSPVWEESTPVRLGELWGTLPETGHFQLDDPEPAGPLPANADDWSLTVAADTSSPVQLAVTGVPPELMPQSPQLAPTSELETFLQRYPRLNGHSAIYPRGVYPGDPGAVVHLAYPSTNSGYRERADEALIHSTRYRLHERYVFPVVGANTDSLHPIMAWWATLFALSMLARYHPESWAGHIAVDASKDAVSIERLLTEALTAVPELLLQTIGEVSQ